MPWPTKTAGSVELDFGLLLQRHAHELVEPAEGDRLAVIRDDGELRLRLRFRADQLDFLKVCSVVAGGLGSQERELGGEIVGGEFASASADSTPFQQIARKKLDVRANTIAGDFSHLCHQSPREWNQPQKTSSHPYYYDVRAIFAAGERGAGMPEGVAWSRFSTNPHPGWASEDRL